MDEDWRHVGWVEVDSGCLVIGDPAHLLPWKDRGRPGVDHQVAIEAEVMVPVTPIADGLALLLQRFGGDGRFPVFGRFDGPELVSVRIDLVDPEE